MISPAWLQRDETQTLLSAFTKAGQELRFVGGCVRDILLGKVEGFDIDAATPATPEKVMALLEQAGLRAIPTGLAHGTVTALIGEERYEITTLRRDVSTDGRHAEVTFTDDWREDAARRDFTINALYLSPEGELFDYFGGQEDLRANRVRFIGDPATRIEEDALRILRYFRFLAQLGCPHFDGTIEGPIFPPQMHAPSWEACMLHADRLDALSGERIRQEMFKLLAVPDLTDDVFLWMMEASVSHPIFPDLPASYCEPLVSLECEFGLAADPLRRLCMCLCNDEYMPFETQLGILRNRWKLSNHEAAQLDRFLAHWEALSPDMPLPLAKRLKRKLGEASLTDLVLISWSVHLAYGMPKAAARSAFAPLLDIALYWEIPVFPVSGEDLLERGFKPGKALGKRLKELDRHWEESDYALSREALLARH